MPGLLSSPNVAVIGHLAAVTEDAGTERRVCRPCWPERVTRGTGGVCATAWR